MDDEARTIGRRVRLMRKARGKSQEVIAELSGISAATLSRIETGLRPLDKRSEVIALANALRIAPSELTMLPMPAPADGDTDGTVEEVRRALRAVSRNRPGGQVASVEQLWARARAIGSSDLRPCCGVALPGLIRDLHTTLAAGRDVAELLDLVVQLEVMIGGWLAVTGAPADLRWEAATLAHRAAQHRDDPTALGIAAWGSVLVLLGAGSLDLAQEELDSVNVPMNSSESMQLAGMLALSQSLVAAADRRPADVAAALDYSAELAQRTGQGNAYLMGFGPVNVGLWRMATALEIGDYELAAATAERLNPGSHPSQERRAAYWTDYGRALAHLRGRHDDAVRALRTAEELFPMRVLRNPFAREAIAVLLPKARRDAVGRELRGMAYRAGLPH